MTARLDYLVKERNRCVVAYSSDRGGGDIVFDIGPSAFGANLTPVGAENYPVATKGLTYTSAAISRIVASNSSWKSGNGNGGGEIIFQFLGATSYTGFVLANDNFEDKNLERLTIPNLAQGSTGMAKITNQLFDGTAVQSGICNLIIEFVTRHVS